MGVLGLEGGDAVVGGQDAIGERCLFGSGGGNGGVEHCSREEEPCGRDVLQKLRSHFVKRVQHP